ncbi:hypothetical protein [Chryseobacterium sp.]|nr:hypothetical protein [Chryseobacterium sp.]
MNIKIREQNIPFSNTYPISRFDGMFSTLIVYPTFHKKEQFIT